MPFFLGFEEPPAPLLTTVQKVFRTPDIDDVGLNKRHADLLRDARQLLVRPVLQGRRDRARLGVHVRAHEARPRPDLGDRLRGRPGARARRGRGRGRAWEAMGMPPERIVRLPRADNFWSVGGPGPCGPGLGDVLRLGRGGRLRPGRVRAGLRVRALPRVLEPRLHGVRAARRRLADAAAEAEHRHRPRARARRADPAAGRVGLRHRRLPGDHGAGSPGSPASPTARASRRRRRTGSSPTTGAG